MRRILLGFAGLVAAVTLVAQPLQRAPQGWWQQEDARQRSSLEPLPYGLEDVLRLQPYRFMERLCTGESIPNVGLMAQEVFPIIPEAVRPPSGNCQHWAMDYSRLVPVLIAAIQQQQQQIDQLRQTVEQLRAMMQPPTAGMPPQPVQFDGSSNWLGDNVPNPHDGTTTIPYYVPSIVSHAQLSISDLSGRIVRRVELPTRDMWSQVTLDLSMLASGMYEYRLVFDGRTVATKRMQLVR
ncbi:MAG: hypothetical protein KatS3mg038_0868 [Candidatus Kapaibacterium sp.]|nr:MAG: hypothetical protein KatS3mg038_0868 [Candidatus Kapabacteria bacterium]